MDAKVVHRKFTDLPMPRGVPVFGNALQLEVERLHQILEDWARALGSMYRLRIARRNVVVISDPALIAQVLRERPERYRRSRQMTAEVFAEMDLVGVFPAEGEDWRRQRQIWMKALSAQKLKTFHDGLAEITGRLLKRWRAAAASGEAVDVQADLMRYTVDVTMRFALGYDANTLEKDGDVIQNHLDKVFPAVGRRISAPFPYWRWFKLPADRELDRALAGAWKEVGQLIEGARQRIKANPQLAQNPTCLLESLIVAHDEAGSLLTDQELFGNTLGVLLAGEDTTANTLSWMIHFISRHGEVQARLQDEADRVLGAAQLLREPGAFDKLATADAVMNETLRLKPVAPLIAASPVEDVVLGDVEIPAGTDLFLIQRVASTQEREFAQPEAFLPERGWSRAGEPGAQRPTMPFGFGPRICPGRQLAISEVRAVTSMLARNFIIEPAPGPGEVHERLAFTMMPVNLRVRFRPRGG